MRKPAKGPMDNMAPMVNTIFHEAASGVRIPIAALVDVAAAFVVVAVAAQAAQTVAEAIALACARALGEAKPSIPLHAPIPIAAARQSWSSEPVGPFETIGQYALQPVVLL